MRILVTVGMGPWPFDRLLSALTPLCAEHDVFAQTGTSAVQPPCPHAAYLSPAELERRIAESDVVITHAGNTVRLVQRRGRVPIAVAREAGRGEMANDHQVAYLRREERTGPVVAVWDVAGLPAAVASHRSTAVRLLAERPLAPRANPVAVAALLDATYAELRLAARPLPPAGPTPAWEHDGAPGRVAVDDGREGNPFARHPLRRYAFAWDALAGLPGQHLDLGAGTGEFAAALAAGTGRPVVAVDPHPAYVATARTRHRHLRVEHVPTRAEVPLADGAVASVSLLDVLEHADDERELLAEARRVLAPGGTLVISVPRRHVFSFLDPDNAKYRWPRLHRLVYRARFGDATYRSRFVDLGDGLRGDMGARRSEHTNYRAAHALRLVEEAGFHVVRVAGANLFWRWLQVPALLGGRRTRKLLAPLVALDGRVFCSPRFAANLFLVARRPHANP
jgi:SAM-dependent methyltransferase/UDP-N-acetylglucosamine transferase subunit ALG13